MVHQHFKLVPSLTVEENFILSRPGPFLLDLDRARAREAIARTAERLSFSIRGDARAGDLSVGEQQRAELVKALDGRARFLVLDEPTAVLTPLEVEPLFAAIRRLRDEGLAVAFVSHKLTEVLALCDRITVLSRGRVVARRSAALTDSEELSALMIGADVSRGDPEGTPEAPAVSTPGGVVLEVERLAARDAAGRPRLRNATFTVREGEIYAVVGVDGNGQRELAFAVAGLGEPDGGTVHFAGRRVDGLGRPHARRLGLALVPDDRRERGLFLDLTIVENLGLSAGTEEHFAKRGRLVARSAMAEWASGLASRFDIRARDLSMPAGALSGGNQQKLLIARETADEPRLLVAMNPTRGLDVGATSAVHALLRKRRESGAGTLVVTTDLDEAVALGDRIGVLFGGVLTEAPRDAGRSALGELMTGAR
jgi:simple sugar transport system ATP-binding protein